MIAPVLPARLLSVHLRSFIVPFCVREGVFEATLPALSEDEDHKRSEDNDSGGGSTAVNSNLGPLRELVPLL